MRLLSLAFLVLPLGALAEPAVAQLNIPAPEVEGAYLKLGFDRLSSFKFVAPEYDPVANPKATPPTGEE